MLEYAWIIPAIPAVSFVLILFFGKRLPKKGAEIGILAVGASFVLSCVAVVPVDRPGRDATGGQRERARARSGRERVRRRGRRTAKPVVTPVVAPRHVVAERRRRVRRRHPHATGSP